MCAPVCRSVSALARVCAGMGRALYFVCVCVCARAWHQPALVPEVEGLAGHGGVLEDAHGVGRDQQQRHRRHRDGPEELPKDQNPYRAVNTLSAAATLSTAVVNILDRKVFFSFVFTATVQ